MFPYLNSITSFIQVGFDQGCAVDESGQRCCRGNQDVYIYSSIQALIAWACDWLTPVGYNHNNSEEKHFWLAISLKCDMTYCWSSAVFGAPSCGDVEKAQAEGCMGNVTPEKRKTEGRGG